MMISVGEGEATFRDGGADGREEAVSERFWLLAKAGQKKSKHRENAAK